MGYKISLFKNIHDNQAVEKEFTYEELLEYFRSIVKNDFVSKIKSPAMVCGTFEGGVRTAKGLISRTIITYDIDFYKHSLSDLILYLKKSLENYSHFYYTTVSSTLEKPKMRLILFITRAVSGDEYRIVSESIAKALLSDLFNTDNILDGHDSVIDRVSYSPAQLSILPIAVDKNFTAGKLKADLVDVDLYMTSTVSKMERVENKPPLNLTDEKIIEYLNFCELKSADYNTWLNVGMALNHQYNGEEKGKELWREWSKTYKESDNNLDKIDYKWETFKNNCDNPVTFASIIKTVNNKSQLPAKGCDLDFDPIVPKSLFMDVRTNKDGIVTNVLSTYRNFKMMCEYYNIEISFDIITKGYVNSFNEKDQNNLNTIMQSAMIVNGMTHGMVPSYVKLIGDRNIVNTFKIIMDSIAWDGEDRLAPFYQSITVEDSLTEVKDLYLLKWLQQMLYLSLHEGRRKLAKNLLVFQGCQSTGKTTWFNSLLPDHLADYIGEGLVLNLNSGTDTLACLQKLFVELGELEQSFKKTDINQFKAFFGRTKDILNLKYLAAPVSYLRTTSFLATVNEVQFLKDKTGNARFLVLPVLKVNGYHNVDMLQLYKQIIVNIGYEEFELDEDQREHQKLINEEFQQPDVIDEQFCEIFETSNEDGEFLNCTEVLEQIGYTKRDINHIKRCDIANVLRKYDFKYRKNIKKWKVKLKES